VDSDSAPAPAPQKAAVPAWARLALLAAGLCAVAWLVHNAGADLVWRVIVAAGPWLPIIFLLEFTWVLVEGIGLLLLLGTWRREIPARSWVMATLTHFTTMMVLPVGRAGAEAVRATLLARYVGGGRSAAASSLMQALVLLGNALVSLACAVVVSTRGVGGDLALLLVGNAVATAFLGGGLYVILRRAKLGGFLGKHFQKMAHFGPELDQHVRENRTRHLPAFAFVVLGRLVQTLQYGFIFAAVAGSFQASGMFIAQGVHLIGAGLGDMVPNQVGVTEGAFRFFAAALGLAAEPERAISLALLARLSTLTVAGLAAAVMQLVPRGASPAGEQPPRAGLDEALQDTAAGS